MSETGMKCKSKSVKIVVSLRTMIKNSGKWNLFWDKINNNRVPIVA